MIVDTYYMVLIPATQEKHKFVTSLTEREFIKTLDAVYDNYVILESGYVK